MEQGLDNMFARPVERETRETEPRNAGKTSGHEPRPPFDRSNRVVVLRVVVAVLVVALAVAVAAAVWLAIREPGSAAARHEPGAYVIPQGSMSDEEAQALADEIAESSRITVSVAAEMELSADGNLRVNFVVPEGNNGFSERLEVEQDGRVVYRSGAVEPGFMVEWVSADGATAGAATATVYAVNAEGVDSGSPASVEVEIVEAESGEGVAS